MSQRDRKRRAGVVKASLFGLWMAIVSIVLLWQITNYIGVMAVISEWEYDTLGREYPTFNYVSLLFLLGLPGYLIFTRRRRRGDDPALEKTTAGSTQMFMRGLFGFAIGFGVASLVVLAALFALPSSNGPVQRIALSKVQVALPREGPTELSGAIIYERTAAFDRDLILVRRHSRFAPIVAPDVSPRELRYFVQLPPVDDRTRGGTSVMTGTLKRQGLPGEMVRLFRYAGFQLDDPHFVLFADAWELRWPYVVTAVQLALGSLLGLLGGLWQRRRLARQRDEYARERG